MSRDHCKQDKKWRRELARKFAALNRVYLHDPFLPDNWKLNGTLIVRAEGWVVEGSVR